MKITGWPSRQRMNPFASGFTLDGATSREIVLQQRKKVLEDELRAVEDRKRRELRQTRRESIIKQAQQIESLIKQLQSPRSGAAPVEGSQKHQSETHLHGVLATVLQQNAELQAALVKHLASPSPQPQSRSRPTTRAQVETSTKIDVKREAKETNAIDSPDTRTFDENVAPSTWKSSKAKPETESSTWAVIDNLPEVEWNDEDEEMLEKLLSGEVDENQFLPLPGVLPESSSEGGSSDTDIQALLEKKKQQQEERLESRRKLALLFEPSSITNSAGIRRPRWRIDQDIDNGVVMPLGEDGAVSELPMAPRQVFRSGVVAVLTVLELQRLLRDKRLRERDKSMRDLDAMLNVYFDATRVWLAKLVRTPLLSILQDASLDIDISNKTSIFQGSNGFTRLLGRQKISPSTMVVDPTNPREQGLTGNEQAKLVKLKVRVKGVADAVVKAIEKGDVPSGILEFWKRLTRDGVYFPSTYPLFPTERAALDLDGLGATRDTAGVASSGHPRFQIILVNFVLLRILIPHVILTPWSVGFSGSSGKSSNKQKAISKNLQNVATLLYMILSRLSPLPPVIGADASLASRLGMRRRSVEVAPAKSNNQMGNAFEQSPEDQRDGHVVEENRFGSIDDLHAQLIPEKMLPLGTLTPFIDEQQHRLEGVFIQLQAKLHSAPLHAIHTSD